MLFESCPNTSPSPMRTRWIGARFWPVMRTRNLSHSRTAVTEDTVSGSRSSAGDTGMAGDGVDVVAHTAECTCFKRSK
jgi:hypothetical protein